jgi:hypothetical protein
MSKFRLPSALIGLLALALIGSGCFNANQKSVIEYNNEVVTTLNLASSAIENSTVVYDETIPNIVTESSTIDPGPVEEAYAAARAEIDAAGSVMDLTSADASQTDLIQTEFQAYLELADLYLDTYTEMVEYYKSNGYKEELDTVSTFDQDLHNQYNEFIKSNNDLVDILAGFVS